MNIGKICKKKPLFCGVQTKAKKRKENGFKRVETALFDARAHLSKDGCALIIELIEGGKKSHIHIS